MTRKTRKRNRFKKLNCSPMVNKTRKHKFSCYNDKQINDIKKVWNLRHPDKKINFKNSRKIWDKLKEYMTHICDNEFCWLKQNFIKGDLYNYIHKYTFAPNAPYSWQKNPNEWLSSIDIISVMKQYEKLHPIFKFIGPSPIDFDNKNKYKVNEICVWPEIYNFSLKKHIENNKKMIGIIFNTDPHFKSGSHWIALFIDINKKFIYFFDSAGDKEPKEINKLIKNIKKQGLELKQPIHFNTHKNHPFQHQRGNSECGMYCLFFIIKLLNNADKKIFHSKVITDKEMEKHRNIYFN